MTDLRRLASVPIGGATAAAASQAPAGTSYRRTRHMAHRRVPAATSAATSGRAG